MAKGWFGERQRHINAGLKGWRNRNRSPNQQVLNKINRLGKTNPLFFSKKEVQSFHLPIKTSIVIPSTKDADKNLTAKEFQERVRKAKTDMAKMFGGYTKISVVGGYYSDRLDKNIEERGAKLVVYTDPETLKENRNRVKNWLLKKRIDWGQESLAYEIEDDLYFIEGKGE